MVVMENSAKTKKKTNKCNCFLLKNKSLLMKSFETESALKYLEGI